MATFFNRDGVAVCSYLSPASDLLPAIRSWGFKLEFGRRDHFRVCPVTDVVQLPRRDHLKFTEITNQAFDEARRVHRVRQADAAGDLTLDEVLDLLGADEIAPEAAELIEGGAL